MGPVMGMTFGSRVLDWRLAKFSFRNELISLAVCIVVGLLIGLGASWSTDAGSWPTQEMAARGDAMGLIVGIAIAVPSGMGVALSILGNNTASLVGVAISASLLPPAVNAGVCWMHAILILTGVVPNPTNSDFALIGAVSLLLTIVNIICIWLAGIAMFTIKEVAPSKSKSAFWTNDIKMARAIKKGNKKIDLEVLKVGLQDAIAKEERFMKGEKVDGVSAVRQQRRNSQMMERMEKTVNKNYTNFNFGMESAPAFTASGSGTGRRSFVADPVVDAALNDIMDPEPPSDESDDDKPRTFSAADMANLLGLDENGDEVFSSVRGANADEEAGGGGFASFFRWK